MTDNYAMVQRAAPYSWEGATQLLATQQDSSPVIVTFPRPVLVVSAYPSICAIAGDDALPIPELDDLFIRIDVDTGLERRLTSRFDATLQNGVGSLPNVTLGSFRDTTGGARVMNLQLGTEGSRPELQLVFSWKRNISGGPYYQSVLAALCFHCELL